MGQTDNDLPQIINILTVAVGICCVRAMPYKPGWRQGSAAVSEINVKGPFKVQDRHVGVGHSAATTLERWT